MLLVPPFLHIKSHNSNNPQGLKTKSMKTKCESVLQGSSSVTSTTQVAGELTASVRTSDVMRRSPSAKPGEECETGKRMGSRWQRLSAVAEGRAP